MPLSSLFGLSFIAAKAHPPTAEQTKRANRAEAIRFLASLGLRKNAQLYSKANCVPDFMRRA
jgi:hypothetical protein